MSRLRLSSKGRWVPRHTPLRLCYPGVRRPPPPAFETLATLPTSSSLQAPVDLQGTRTTTPNALAVPIPLQPVAGTARKQFLGVELPLKPTAPVEGGSSPPFLIYCRPVFSLIFLSECCQSGCAICVYDLFLEDSQDYHSTLADARAAILSKINSQGLTIREQDWPLELGSMEDEAEGDEDPKVRAEREFAATKAGLDPTLR
jgi:hypothetical protein